jgi:hypothetical protein
MTPKQIAITSTGEIVLGCLIAWIGTTTWLDAIGITLGGIGLVGVISAAFYAVGQSEDRERAREEAERLERGPNPFGGD